MFEDYINIPIIIQEGSTAAQNHEDEEFNEGLHELKEFNEGIKEVKDFKEEIKKEYKKEYTEVIQEKEFNEVIEIKEEACQEISNLEIEEQTNPCKTRKRRLLWWNFAEECNI